MNFNKIAKSFNQVLEAMGGGWVALLIGVLVVALIIFLIYRSGKQIKFKIPFLPASIGTIKIGKSDVDKLAASKQEAGEKQPQQKPGEAILQLLRQIEALSGNKDKIYQIPIYLVLSRYDSIFELSNQISGNVVQKLSLPVDGVESGGHCVVTADGILIYHDDPSLILEPLKNLRPERPLDGVILSIPIEHVLETSTLRKQEHSDWYFKEFWKIQEAIEFILPTYSILAGLEGIDGFDSFANIACDIEDAKWPLGFSIRDNAPTESAAQCAELAFSELLALLRKTMLQSSIESDEGLSREAVAFLGNLSQRKADVVDFFSAIFDENPLSRPYLFRGLYGTGVHPTHSGHEHLFLRDLFSYKVFKEAALAVPLKERMISSSKNLKNFQYGAAVALVLLLGWSTYDLVNLARQNSGLEKAADEIRYVLKNSSGYEVVRNLLDVLRKTDASEERCCGVLPITEVAPINSVLEDFFGDQVFENAIFPELECRNRQLLGEKVGAELFASDGRLRDGSFNGWLTSVRSNVSTYEQLQTKMIYVNEDASQSSVALGFSEILQDLYGEPLPKEFFGSRAELYLSAVSGRSYSIKPLGAGKCPGAVSSLESAWPVILEASRAQVPVETRKQAAPLEFIQNILAFESSDIGSVSIDARSLQSYLRWHAIYEEDWEQGYDQSFCGVTTSLLRAISSDLNKAGYPGSRRSTEIDEFESSCADEFASQFESDNQSSIRPLYQQISVDGKLSPIISESSEQVFDFIDEMSELSFARDMTTNKATRIERGGDFYWSVDLLNQAITYVDDYLAFSRDRFPTTALPENLSPEARKSYLSQAIVLAQLQRELDETIEIAKTGVIQEQVSSLQSLDQREAEIADRVANFKKALNSLVTLDRQLQRLGFLALSTRFLASARNQAEFLLEEVDSLFESENIFNPRKSVSWEAHAYPEAFYGLVSESQILDYFRAQELRTEFIAERYAAPLVTFLKNTESSVVSSSLTAKWERTLIEINKKRAKNPANEIEAFKTFLIGSFAETNLSNCHEKTKTYLEQDGNSIFSERFRIVSSTARDHCQRFRADHIEREYGAVRAAFNELLAPYFPFNESFDARPLPALNFRKFISSYPGQSNGLAERIRVLAWKYPSNEAARSFIRDLDSALMILNQLFKASNGDQSLGLEVAAVFDVSIPGSSDLGYSNHISDVSLRISNETSSSRSPTSLRWNLGDPLQLAINWASGSPYKPRKPGHPYTGNQIEFEETGTWSILQLINAHRVETLDLDSTLDESVLLRFDLDVMEDSGKPETKNSSSFVRLTLFGADPETKERIALTVPEKFPIAPPKIKRG